MTTQHWGYGDKPGTVQVAVPTDMVEEVAAFVQNPEGFMAALARATSTEDALSLMMVEVEPGIWLDPRRIVGLLEGVVGTRILLDTGGTMSVDGTSAALLKTITEKLSEARDKMLGITEGAPPA
jgi:hypothetical protein